MAINCQPVRSPDGKRIAYISDFSGASHLNVIDIRDKSHVILGSSGGQINIDNHSWPVWAPDGNYISTSGNVYGLDGGVKPLPTGVNYPIRFSADGQLVYYVDLGDLFQYDGGMNKRVKLSAAGKDFESCTLSPDAHWWTYIMGTNADKQLVVRDLTNNRERVSVSSLVLKY
jgi:Tol biopolymer transport system component